MVQLRTSVTHAQTVYTRPIFPSPPRPGYETTLIGASVSELLPLRCQWLSCPSIRMSLYVTRLHMCESHMTYASRLHWLLACWCLCTCTQHERYSAHAHHPMPSISLVHVHVLSILVPLLHVCTYTNKGS